MRVGGGNIRIVTVPTHFRLVLTVSIERLVAIKFPLQAKFLWKPTRLATVIASIFLISFCLTFYHHIHYCIVFVRSLCADTQRIYYIEAVTALNSTSYTFKRYIEISTILNVAFIVACPLIALTGLNIGLIVVLKSQHKQMFGSHSSDDKISQPNRARNSEKKVRSF